MTSPQAVLRNSHPLIAKRARLQAYIERLISAENRAIERINALHAAARAAQAPELIWERRHKPWLHFPSRLAKATRFAREVRAADHAAQAAALRRSQPEVSALERKITRLRSMRDAATARVVQITRELGERVIE